MTVLQVCAFAAPYEGNFIKSLKALGKALSDLGHKMVYAFPENARRIPWCIELSKSNDVYFLPLAKARIRRKTYSDLRKIYQAYPDLLIVHSHFELYDVPVSLTVPKGVKVFWHLHDALEIYNSIKHKTIHKIQYGLLNKRAVLLSVSYKHMSYVLKCGFPKAAAFYVPNGIDLDRIELVSIPAEYRQYDFTIFGWEFERKGVDLAIESTRHINDEFELAVIGGPNIAELIQSRYGELNSVKVVRPVKDINVLYRNTKCFMHISRAEGLSYALLEAIYAGLPVICSDISENKFAEAFPTVVMVQSENIHSISVAMKNQLANNEISQDKIAVSRKMIEENYSINSWVRNVLDHYGVH